MTGFTLCVFFLVGIVSALRLDSGDLPELYALEWGMTHDGKPVSLRPLKFEDAVKELLKVKPEPKQAKSKKRAKKAVRKTDKPNPQS